MMLAEQNFVFLLREVPTYNQIWIIKSPVNYFPNNVEEDEFLTISSKIEKFSKK
jgi:hypothetical protein